MRTLYTIHPTDAKKLQEVIAQMSILGSPTIRAVECSDYLMALEGTHRIAAAAVLSLPINLVILEQYDIVQSDSLDWQDLEPGESYTAGFLAGEAFNRTSGIYHLQNDYTVEAV